MGFRQQRAEVAGGDGVTYGVEARSNTTNWQHQVAYHAVETLNVEAPERVMQWARRITLERLAQRLGSIQIELPPPPQVRGRFQGAVFPVVPIADQRPRLRRGRKHLEPVAQQIINVHQAVAAAVGALGLQLVDLLAQSKRSTR